MIEGLDDLVGRAQGSIRSDAPARRGGVVSVTVAGGLGLLLLLLSATLVTIIVLTPIHPSNCKHTGYMNTAVCTSRITYIDGGKGVLRYRGYPIVRPRQIYKGHAERPYVEAAERLSPAPGYDEKEGAGAPRSLLQVCVCACIFGLCAAACLPAAAASDKEGGRERMRDTKSAAGKRSIRSIIH